MKACLGLSIFWTVKWDNRELPAGVWVGGRGARGTSRGFSHI